jgi:hypothetical protein
MSTAHTFAENALIIANGGDNALVRFDHGRRTSECPLQVVPHSNDGNVVFDIGHAGRGPSRRRGDLPVMH